MLTSGTSAERNATPRTVRKSSIPDTRPRHIACGSGESVYGHSLTNWETTSPLGFAQYSQMPCCFDGSAGSLSADQCVSATWVPFGNALPSLAVQGAAMNLSVSFCPENFEAIALTTARSLLFLATVSSYQRRL